ncbi:MAG: DNA polymerase III subunit gamma/tau, partial [Spirochaetales bacterium]|nr:DNA polymerase III subunit gamma/tau [Spirochaetales bacterium]
MAYEVTATRKRPQRFEDLAGQEFVVSTLKNAIAQGRIAHAYLFSGPRGVGKTTSARLLAKALNCVHGPTPEPCGECDNCRGIAKGSSLDVIEIDGASNTGVNDVRVIKEEVMFPPTSSRYKIYIIDEVHMLSQSAFNALLKTIEEPPEYVVFIFATTETQKVPATIRSRCQQFNFQLIPLETIKKLLAQAASEMEIEAEDDALFWIAKESTGSMRDAYTLFDQVVAFSNGKITLAKIREKLGLVGIDRINDIMHDVLAKKGSDSVAKVNDLLSRGMSIEQIIKDFTDYFRSLLLIRKGVKSANVLGEQPSAFPSDIQGAYNEEQLEAALDMFLNLYRDIRYSLNPRFELELAISRLSRLRYVASTATVIEQLARLKNDLINGTISPLNPVLADIPSTAP